MAKKTLEQPKSVVLNTEMIHSGIIKLERRIKELDGAPLMHTAFSPSNPIIVLDDLSTESGKSRQQGYMEIFAGAMMGIRNPKAHDNMHIAKNRAIHFLYLSSC